MNVNNYGDRNMPSVHNARANIWNRYNAHAQMARDQSVFSNYNCRGPMMGGGMFGMPMFGGFGMPMFGSFGHGNQNVNVSIGPSKSYVAGNVLGQIGGLVKNNWTPISNFCVNAFNKIFHKA